MLNDTEIVTSAQMRAIESAAISSGTVTGLTLMERAGRAVAGQIRLHWPKAGRVTVLCGPGNNGGDGYVVARHLHLAGWRVTVLGCETRPAGDAAAARASWTGDILPLTLPTLRRTADADVYVDAIFGTGLTRPPEGEIAAILRHLGGYGGDGHFYRPRLVAVDAPSALCLDSGAVLGSGRDTLPWWALRAEMTVTFDRPKIGHLLEHGPVTSGRLVVADIGLKPFRPKDRIMTHVIWPQFDTPVRERTRMANWLRKAEGGHKYSHGAALVVAGRTSQGGAARLAARAALRVGAGLVTICPPGDALQEHAQPPDALMRRKVDGADDLRALLTDRRITALCLGPGCGVDRAAALLPIACKAKLGLVLDADALTALAQDDARALHDCCVLTPHGGEFARLFPDLAQQLSQPALTGPAFSRLDAVRLAAKRSGAVVLLKGPDTVIACPSGRTAIHSAFDVPWLATAGSGDVLAGLICGLMARGLPAFDAATNGALLHATAARAFGPGLIADDLPDMIPQVLRAMD